MVRSKAIESLTLNSKTFSSQLAGANAVGIGIFAFLLRLGAGIWTGGLWHPELSEYNKIAQSILAGRGFSMAYLMTTYYSYVTPLHAWPAQRASG